MYRNCHYVTGPGCCCKWKRWCGAVERSHYQWRHWDCWAAVGQRYKLPSFCVWWLNTSPSVGKILCSGRSAMHGHWDWLICHKTTSQVDNFVMETLGFYVWVCFIDSLNTLVEDRFGCGDEAELWMDSTDVCRHRGWLQSGQTAAGARGQCQLSQRSEATLNWFIMQKNLKCRIRYVTQYVIYVILSICICFLAQRYYSRHTLYLRELFSIVSNGVKKCKKKYFESIRILNNCTNPILCIPQLKDEFEIPAFYMKIPKSGLIWKCHCIATFEAWISNGLVWSPDNVCCFWVDQSFSVALFFQFPHQLQPKTTGAVCTKKLHLPLLHVDDMNVELELQTWCI